MKSVVGVLVALALALPLQLQASGPSAKSLQVVAQGRTWSSLRKLPDWSGVWILSDESWTEAFAAAVGQDDGRVPFTPRYLAIRAANISNEATTRFTPSNESWCFPVGIPESAGIPIGHEYLFTPARVTVIFENGIVRRIDTSGRPHPDEEEMEYSFAGHSIGHWEGNTLVVDTVGLTSQAEFLIGLHVTQKTHLQERISRKDAETLQIDSVLSDPEIFTRPFAYTRFYKHSTSAPVEYFPCVEGARDVYVNGVLKGTDLDPPPSEGQP